jgi:hypothetical protein
MHFHYQAKEMEDIAGRINHQAPSSKRSDRYHDREGYVGSRKAIHMHILEPRTVINVNFTLSV